MSGLAFSVLALLTITSASDSCSVPKDDPPVVHTASGSVRGSYLKSRLGRKIYSFRAIRYAQPPLGNLRFRPPVEHSWQGIFDASEDGPMCPQPRFNNTSEDCLRINVYTPELPRGRNNLKLPVIVFLHDSAFYVYGGVWLLRGPEYLLDHNVILVTLNYRLGTLGYLSTGDAEAPGNNGMKDQVLALKWVQKNIVAFGGDKDSVTLLGYSAGGSSVSLHMVSPMARGLFHRGIMMSGAAFPIIPFPHGQLEIARKQASFVGCPTDTSKKIVECLRTKSAEELGDYLSHFTEIGSGSGFIMTPVIEDDFGQERYLPDHPSKLIEEKNFYPVPLIAGRTKDEFAYTAYAWMSNETLIRTINDEFEKYAPILFLYEKDTPKSRRVTSGVRSSYFNNENLSNETVVGLVNVLADSIVGFPVQRAVELFAKNSDKPVYYYDVTHLAGVSEFYLPGSNGTIPYGVVHQDELIYLFYNSFSHPFFDENYPAEAEAVAKLTTLFANFATTGNPTPKDDALFNNVIWEAFNMQSQKYLDIGKTFEMRNHLYEDRYNFWARFYPVSEYAR